MESSLFDRIGSIPRPTGPLRPYTYQGGVLASSEHGRCEFSVTLKPDPPGLFAVLSSPDLIVST